MKCDHGVVSSQVPARAKCRFIEFSCLVYGKEDSNTKTDYIYNLVKELKQV